MRRAAAEAGRKGGQHAQEVQQVTKGKARQSGPQWKPGEAPSQAVTWAVKTLAKAGTLGIVGVYPQTDRFFPLGAAMNKNLTIQMGNCNHRTYIPKLLEMVEGGIADPTQVLSHIEPMADVIAAYKEFDLRHAGWIKVELKPGG
jgi:threonine dehydrogenase-like Zn-dependent dehydrogenase